MSPATQTEPNDPPPQEDPTHDVPMYPEQDPPPGSQTPITAASPSKDEKPEPRQADPVQPEDVDEDDLDPKVPHSPPDGGKGKIVFDENWVPS